MRRFLAVLFLMVMIPYVTTLAWTGRLESEDLSGFSEFPGFGGGDGPGGSGGFQTGGFSGIPGGSGGFGSSGFPGVWDGSPASGAVVIVERGGKEIPVSVEEFLTGVVAAQIPAGYGMETLKSQAVLARTYVYEIMDGETSIPEAALDLDVWSRGQMEKAWGSGKFAENYGRIVTAVSETEGLVLTYEGTFAEPLFCRAAAGVTRDSERYPYLKAAESPGDLETEGFLTIISWNPGTFADRINEIPGSSDVSGGEVLNEIQIVERDSSGYVKQIQIGKKTYTGEEIQYALRLPSSCFSFSNMEGKIRVTSKGIGHGYGFSQAGANALERENGMDFKDLLFHYFRNVEITKISDMTE